MLSTEADADMLVMQSGESTSLLNKHDLYMTDNWNDQIVDLDEIIDTSTSNITLSRVIKISR